MGKEHQPKRQGPSAPQRGVSLPLHPCQAPAQDRCQEGQVQQGVTLCAMADHI